MMLTRIAIIGTAGLPSRYGGFETLAEYLVEKLSSRFEITVYCSKKHYTTYPNSYKGAKLEYLPFNANGAQSIPYDIVSMLHARRSHDIYLLLGVSGAILLPLFRIFSRKKIITNIDGLEWKRDKWNFLARRFLKFSEKIAVNFSDEIVTDNADIRKYVEHEYDVESTLIAYGGDHAKKINVSENTLNEYPFLSSPYGFSVCRIEPENNIHLILSGVRHVKKHAVVIVGNWDNSAYGKALKSEYMDARHIHLLDPIYDQHLLNQLRSNCSFYLHGHSAGGTNPSLVEAMSLGLPIFAFDVGYNRASTLNEALYFKDSNDLAEQLKDFDDNVLISIGSKMKEIAEKRYTWDSICNQYAALFEDNK